MAGERCDSGKGAADACPQRRERGGGRIFSGHLREGARMRRGIRTAGGSLLGSDGIGCGQIGCGSRAVSAERLSIGAV